MDFSDKIENIGEAIKLIDSSNNIVLSAHSNPDGDAIGATFALYLALRKEGHSPKVLLEDFNERYSVIPYSDKVYKGDLDDLEVDLFITLDCGDLYRLNEKHREIFLKAKNTINIDHHESNDGFATVNIIDVNMTSTSEVVFNLIDCITANDKDILSCIYAGIVYDSAGFRHSSVTSNTHKIAGIALDMGVDFNKIYNNILLMHTMSETRVFAKALENTKYDTENEIIYTTLTKEEIESVGSSTNEVGQVVSYLLTTEGFSLAIFAYEKEENIIKVSLRSDKLDVNYLASLYGGGGHKKASGLTIKGDIKSAVNEVYNKAKELIKDEKFI